MLVSSSGADEAISPGHTRSSVLKEGKNLGVEGVAREQGREMSRQMGSPTRHAYLLAV